MGRTDAENSAFASLEGRYNLFYILEIQKKKEGDKLRPRAECAHLDLGCMCCRLMYAPSTCTNASTQISTARQSQKAWLPTSSSAEVV